MTEGAADCCLLLSLIEALPTVSLACLAMELTQKACEV